MATSAYTGFGTTVGRGDGASPEVFTTIAEVTDCEGPGFKQRFVEATNNDSTNNTAEFISEKIVEILNSKITINYLPSNVTHETVHTDLFAVTARNYKITVPMASFIIFKAFVEQIDPKYPMSKITADVSFKCTEKPTLMT